ncbi:MAG: DUF3196 family protein [Erysipelotrichaceae bacterium]
MNYYDEIIEEIKIEIEHKRYMEALALINQELKMPYIPDDILKKLNILYQETTWALKDTSTHQEMSIDEIYDGLFKDEVTQLKAAYTLSFKNLREHFEIIQHYFDSKNYGPAQSIIIDGLIRQEISEEFKVNVLGQEIVFVPKYVEVFEESDGFSTANDILDSYFGNDQPSLLIMAQECLLNEAFLRLPMNFSEDEASLIANSIAVYLMELMSDDEGITTFLDNNRIDRRYLIKLISQKIDI